MKPTPPRVAALGASPLVSSHSAKCVVREQVTGPRAPKSWTKPPYVAPAPLQRPFKAPKKLMR